MGVSDARGVLNDDHREGGVLRQAQNASQLKQLDTPVWRRMADHLREFGASGKGLDPAFYPDGMNTGVSLFRLFVVSVGGWVHA